MLCAALPVDARVSSPYGWRWLNGRSDLHSGVDLGAPEGTAVFALLMGRVLLAAPPGALSGYGNVVVLEHGDVLGQPLYSLYAHLSSMSVQQGQLVATGDELGRVGRTAGTSDNPGKVFQSSGAHLHLELLEKWPPDGRDLNRLDPGAVLPQLGVIVPSSGPLLSACGGAAASPATLAPPQRNRATSRETTKTAGLGAGALLFLAFAWAMARKQKRQAR